MSITDSNLWTRYSEVLAETLRKADPTITDGEINRQLAKISRNATVPIVIEETRYKSIPDVKMTLYEAIDELEQSDNLITGAGVIVEPHRKNLSPYVNMIIRWKKERSGIKKLMFAAADKGDQVKVRYYNKLQLNLKSNKMNALYGILALVSSAFFDEYVPYAVTSSGRQLISHSAMMFESVLGNNCKFLSMGECINWIDTVCKKHHDDNVDSFIKHPTIDEVYERMVDSFISWPGDECNFLREYIENLTDTERVFVYYKNNLVDFIRNHEPVAKLLEKIFRQLPTDLTLMGIDENLWKKYGDPDKELNDSNWRKMLGKNLFLDPYSPPKTIEATLKSLREIIWKYIYISFLPMSVVSRLNKQSRKAVAVIDTDSNMIQCKDFVELCLDMCHGIDTGIRDDKMNRKIAMMIIANIVDPCVVDMIHTLFTAKRVEKEYFPNMVMKNEWYYSLMLFAMVKKRYAAMAQIQEGLILPKPKADIKGFDFKKADIPKPIQKKMIDILIDRILLADKIVVSDIVDDINQLDSEIKESLRCGKTEYWKVATYKDASAYAYPERIQVYKGGSIWNILHPEDKLENLDKACIAKLKKGAVIQGVECGNVIAVPMRLKEVPSEIVEQMDIDLMSYNILSAFNSVLDCFDVDIETTTEKTASGAKILKRRMKPSAGVVEM